MSKNDPNKYGTPVMITQGEHSRSIHDKRTWDMYGFKSRESLEDYIQKGTKFSSPGMMAMSILSDCQEMLMLMGSGQYTPENIRKHINVAKLLIDKAEEPARSLKRIHDALETEATGEELVAIVVEADRKAKILDQLNAIKGQQALKKDKK